MPNHTLPAPLARALGRETFVQKLVGRAGIAVAGLGALAIGGFAAYFLQERSQEQPEHEVFDTDGAFSLRRYAPALTAETRRIGSRDSAMSSAFGALASYIFAKPGGRARASDAGASDDRKIAMTVPVTATPGESTRGTEWIVRFNLPKKWSRADLPEPGPGVAITEQPARTVAVVQFAGNAKDERIVAENRAKLLLWIERRGLIALSEPEFAGYNAPIIPGPLRRNELWIEVDGMNATPS